MIVNKCSCWIRAILLSLLASLFASTGAFAVTIAPGDTTSGQDWLVVPVFFATNRSVADNGLGIDYEEERNGKGLLFGVKNVPIPLPEHLELSPSTLSRLGWQIIHYDKALPQDKKPTLPGPESFKIPDRRLSRSEVYPALERYHNECKSDETVIFIHGCCATFQTSLERTAKVAARMQVPIVVFDWASPIGFKRYLQNETLAEQSYDDLCDFLAAVEKVVPTSKTTIIGHSMGATLLSMAMMRRFERIWNVDAPSKYREIVLSQPDTDARSYLRHCQAIVQQAQTNRIYFVSDDDRLSNSALVHGGFERLGRPGVLLPELLKQKGQDLIDVTACGGGHEIPFAVLADMHHNGKLKQPQFTSCETEPHLWVIQKVDNLPPAKTKSDK